MLRVYGPLATIAGLAFAVGSAMAQTPAPDQRVVSAPDAVAAPEVVKPEATRTPEETKPATADAASVVPAPVPPAFTLALKDAAAKIAAKAGTAEHRDREALTAFYDARQDAPLWVTASGLTPAATALIAEIRLADDWGLKSSDFDLPTLAAGQSASNDDLLDAELRLSVAALKYARYARGGRVDPRSITKFLDRTPPTLEPKLALEQIAVAQDPGAYLRGLHPQHPQFERLRLKYNSMRRLAQEAAAIAKIENGPKIAPGTSHPDVVLVRARLSIVSGKSDAGGADSALYDDALAAAVREFQSANGIRPADGAITNVTRRALNSIAQGNPRKLLANMEQWRWMPETLGDYYVNANIPEYTLRVVSNGKVIHSERIIVGKTNAQTPIFSDEMEQVIFHPFWGVPDSIKRNEILPSLRGGGNLLARNGLRIQYRGRDVDPETVDWNSTDIRNFHVYQPPGGSNVLGVVKFRFPNKHDVYMHDTPTKNLFSSAVRTYSHGCMRVQNPVRLAELILAEDRRMSSDQVRALAAPGARQDNQLNLTHKIPVHITYFTAVIDPDGKEHYFSDVYGHDERIALALEGKFSQIARVPEPAATATPVRRVVETRQSSGGGDWLQKLFSGF